METIRPINPKNSMVFLNPTSFRIISRGAPPRPAPAVPIRITNPVTFATCFGSSHNVPSFIVPIKPHADHIPIKNLAHPPINGLVVFPKIKHDSPQRVAAIHRNNLGPKRSIVIPRGSCMAEYDQL